MRHLGRLDVPLFMRGMRGGIAPRNLDDRGGRGLNLDAAETRAPLGGLPQPSVNVVVIPFNPDESSDFETRSFPEESNGNALSIEPEPRSVLEPVVNEAENEESNEIIPTEPEASQAESEALVELVEEEVEAAIEEVEQIAEIDQDARVGQLNLEELEADVLVEETQDEGDILSPVVLYYRF